MLLGYHLISCLSQILFCSTSDKQAIFGGKRVRSISFQYSWECILPFLRVVFHQFSFSIDLLGSKAYWHELSRWHICLGYNFFFNYKISPTDNIAEERYFVNNLISGPLGHIWNKDLMVENSVGMQEPMVNGDTQVLWVKPSLITLLPRF